VKWARRRPAIALLTMAMALLTLLGAGAFVWQSLKTAAALATSETHLYANIILLAERYLASGQPERAEEQLDRCPEGLRGWEWRYLKRRCHRQGILLGGHDGRVLAARYSPDGRRLATTCQDGSVRLWDPASGALLQTLRSPTGFSNTVCFTVLEKRLLLVSAEEDQTVRVWDTATGKVVQVLDGAGNLVVGSRDGRLLATVGGRQVLRVLAASSEPEKVFREVWQQDLGPEKKWVNAIALSPDGRYLAACGFNGLMKVWELHLPDAVRELPSFTFEAAAGQTNLWAVAFSANSKYLAAGSAQPVVWEIGEKGQKGPGRYFTGTGDLHCGGLSFSPNGDRLAATFRDGLVRIWDTQKGTIVSTLRNGGYNLGVMFSPDGRSLALTRGREATIEPIDSAPVPGSRILDAHGVSRYVWAVAFSPDGQLASRGTDEVLLWNLETGAPRQRIKVGGKTEPGANIAFTSDGSFLFAGCGKDRLKVLDTATGAESDSPTILAGDTRCCAVSADGRALATTEGSNHIILWDLPGGTKRLAFGGDTGEIKALAFRPRHRQLASCGSGGVVKLWDTVSGKTIRTFPGAATVVAGVAFSVDGNRMATANADLTVRIWNPDNGQELFKLHGHSGYVNAVAYSPDGRRLASCGTEGTVKLWDTGSGQEVLTLTEHQGPVSGVAFSPDGNLLATCSHDGTVRVWDARPTGK
jgi:WD40 repeat protein